MRFTMSTHAPSKERTAILLLTALLLLAVVIGAVSTPVTMTDTDLWYHLSGGRHLFTKGGLQESADFSFLQPTRSFTNYYWLFQATSYLSFTIAGYQGLIILRTAFTLLLGSALLLLLVPWNNVFKQYDTQEEQRMWNRRALFGLLWAELLIAALFPRMMMVRPHLITYSFAALFLLILEKHPRWAWTLLPLGALWMNFHGIAYPLLLSICGAYLLERYWQKIHPYPATTSAERKSSPLWILAAMLTVLATPHGSDLLSVPFTTARMQELFVQELAPFALAKHANFTFFPLWRLHDGMSFLVVLAAPVSLLLLLITRRCKLSYAILVAAGMVLITRHDRLFYEYAILSAPVVGAALDMSARKTLPASSISRLAFATFFTVLICTFLLRPLTVDRAYPYSFTKLPQGCANFLEKLEQNVKVLHHPNYGGYLQWRLAPRHQIFVDMQMSLFTEKDLFLSTRAFKDGAIFERILKQYAPECILFPRAAEHRALLEAYPYLVPVFFDNTSILYVDATRLPEVATHYNLENIDALTSDEVNFDEIAPEEAVTLYRSIAQMLEIAPFESRLNFLAGELAIRGGDTKQAQSHAAILLEHHPQLHSGYFLMGQAAMLLNSWDDAVQYFEQAALLAPNDEERSTSLRNSYIAALRAGRYDTAYQAIIRAAPPFDTETSYKDLFESGIGAAAAGQQEEALIFLEFAMLATPESDAPFRRHIQEAMEKLHMDASGR